ncbi:MAG: hypothetical protein ISS43_02495 [Candidatus Omnitrophica bacterium]|nr:hypothetical protein [Candidatus Omnitrophota bacterium]
MNAQLSEQKAKFHAVIIGIFYLISGIWEFMMGITELESTPSGVYFLLDIYRDYLITLGVITILVGAVLLFRINIGRLAALVLAWWNLFTGILIGIWFEIYTLLVIKTGTVPSLLGYILYEVLLIFACIMIRLYIINMLKISKAGYVFLRKSES